MMSALLLMFVGISRGGFEGAAIALQQTEASRDALPIFTALLQSWILVIQLNFPNFPPLRIFLSAATTIHAGNPSCHNTFLC